MSNSTGLSCINGACTNVVPACSVYSISIRFVVAAVALFVALFHRCLCICLKPQNLNGGCPSGQTCSQVSRNSTRVCSAQSSLCVESSQCVHAGKLRHGGCRRMLAVVSKGHLLERVSSARRCSRCSLTSCIAACRVWTAPACSAATSALLYSIHFFLFLLLFLLCCCRRCCCCCC
jgi:hypothetical protein